MEECEWCGSTEDVASNDYGESLCALCYQQWEEQEQEDFDDD